MNKLKYLDGLRGCAALIVVFHHFANAFYPATYLGVETLRHSPLDVLFLTTPLGIFVAGNFAVGIFFILSGYVLSIKYFETGDAKVLTSGAIRRYFRLLPPVVFSMALAWGLMVLGWMPVKEAAAITGSSGWLAQCWNFVPDFGKLLEESFFGVFFNYQANYNNVLWTMTYEFFGSFLVFGAAAILGPAKWRRGALIILFLLFIKTYFAGFILGMILSDTKVRSPGFFVWFKNPWSAAALLVFGLLLGTYPTFVDIKTTGYGFLATDFFGYAPTFYHMVGAFFVMLAVLSSAGLQKFFSLRFPLFLGRISFSMYAMHVIIIGSLSCGMFLLLKPQMDYHTAVGITFVVTMGVSLLGGWVVNRFVDEPGVRLSSTIQKRFFPL